MFWASQKVFSNRQRFCGIMTIIPKLNSIGRTPRIISGEHQAMLIMTNTIPMVKYGGGMRVRGGCVTLSLWIIIGTISINEATQNNSNISLYNAVQLSNSNINYSHHYSHLAFIIFIISSLVTLKLLMSSECLFCQAENPRGVDLEKLIKGLFNKLTVKIVINNYFSPMV